MKKLLLLLICFSPLVAMESDSSDKCVYETHSHKKRPREIHSDDHDKTNHKSKKMSIEFITQSSAENDRKKDTAQTLLLLTKASQAKPFKCTYPGCTYACTTSSDLKRHIRIHTDEKPFKCTHPDCTYSCTQACNLKRHMRKHK